MATQEVAFMSKNLPIASNATGQDLARKALHVRIKFEKLGNSRKVRTSQIDVRGETETSKTDKSLVRVSKKLLDSPELKAIGTADSEIKAYLELMCLPFDTGIRLVPIPAVEEVDKQLRIHAAKRALLVDAFMACYESEIERARTRLGPLYNSKDYPPAEEVRREFGFYYEFVSFGTPGVLADINPEIFAQEREKQAVALENAAAEIQQLMRATLADMVERLKVALTPTEDGKKRKLYDTAVTNLQEWLGTFNLRNVTDDRELSSLVEQARSLVNGVNVDSLRDVETLRLNVRQGMEEVAQKLAPLVTTRTRKMRLNETAVQ